LRTEVYFCTKIRMQNELVILRLYWNPITLVFIWKVLRQAFRWYHYFLNLSTFGWVISLFKIFSKYLQSLLIENNCSFGNFSSSEHRMLFLTLSMPKSAGHTHYIYTESDFNSYRTPRFPTIHYLYNPKAVFYF
jgi:hypothetical protein